MSNTAQRKEVAHWYEVAIRQAREGDRRVADHLLAVFASLADDPDAFKDCGGVPPVLVKYIAECVSDWRKRRYEDAKTWFRIDRPANAPDQTGPQHVAAMRAYMLARANAGGVEAARAAAVAESGLTEDQVRYMLDKDKPKRPPWFKGRAIGELEFAALMQIDPSLHDRVLNPPRKKYQRSR